MEFRKAIERDIPGIMDIIRQAQAYLKKSGIDQWQSGYPDEETIRNDIRRGYGYVLTDGGVVGTVAVVFDGEKTYDVIYEGEWLTSGSYATVHRIAVADGSKGKGLAGVMMKHIEDLCRSRNVRSIKADTHEDNRSMQEFLRKNGFQYCGIIYLEDHSKRVAFEKQI